MTSFTPRAFMEILVERCPSYAEELPDCPLAALRVEPDVATRKQRLAAMTDGEIEGFLQLHLWCVQRACGGQGGRFDGPVRYMAATDGH